MAEEDYKINFSVLVCEFQNDREILELNGCFEKLHQTWFVMEVWWFISSQRRHASGSCCITKIMLMPGVAMSAK